MVGAQVESGVGVSRFPTLFPALTADGGPVQFFGALGVTRSTSAGIGTPALPVQRVAAAAWWRARAFIYRVWLDPVMSEDLPEDEEAEKYFEQEMATLDAQRNVFVGSGV